MARKIIGIAFIVAAIFGLIFSIAGIALVWGVKAPLTESLVNSIDLIDTTLEATSSGLTVVDDTLTNTLTDLSALENTIQTAGKGVDDSVPMVESISSLLSGNIPQAIEATQTALASLQSAATTLESTLQLVTAIPFLPIENYAPDVSFTTALDEVSQSLDSIPESLGAMEDTLATTQGNLTLLAAQLRIISRNISELKSNVYEIQLVLGQYLDVISTLQEKIDSFRSNLSTIITVTAWIFTIIFIWLGIAQLGLLTQGLERVDWPRSQPSDEKLPASEPEFEEESDERIDNGTSELPPDSEQ
jgi:methyl-accepting chemotaxis protein